MTTNSTKIGHYQVTGNPVADWSHGAAVLADWHAEQVFGNIDTESPVEENQAYRQRLLAAGSIDDLSEEDLALSTSLAQQNGGDLSYWPGGENYRVSVASPTNPLGLPGDLWGAVSEAEDGALVSALIRPAGDSELDIMVPGGEGWQPMLDLGIIEDDTLVGLAPEAVELFQKYDRDNTLGVVSSYPLSESGPYPSEEQLSVPMPKEIVPLRDDDPRRKTPIVEVDVEEGSEEDSDVEEKEDTVTAAVTLDTADDLTAAIAAAVEDPELRWYVERRVAALGLEASLPWQQD